MFGDTSEALLDDIQNALEVKPNTNDEDRVNINNLSAILANPEEESLCDLPKHQRCAAHTLNRIATVSLEKAFSNSSYKRFNCSAFGKALALWNKQQRFVP